MFSGLRIGLTLPIFNPIPLSPSLAPLPPPPSNSQELAQEHYKDLKEKPFFPDLVGYIVSGPVVCVVLEGPGVVLGARKVIGATNPSVAEPGTIRGDLAVEVSESARRSWTARRVGWAGGCLLPAHGGSCPARARS